MSAVIESSLGGGLGLPDMETNSFLYVSASNWAVVWFKPMRTTAVSGERLSALGKLIGTRVPKSPRNF
ncbi:hypothetical protein [Comamonas avium]|uniref:Uncharacterized protein n=1 Tax=Comamonas avium TaxID=2762231 RepID=A0ABR8S795_9BURK|nr:hypothetical protein [Comamonas avium]MBD7959338.1 hypothetical protein [Comamonas avium]